MRLNLAEWNLPNKEENASASQHQGRLMRRGTGRKNSVSCCFTSACGVITAPAGSPLEEENTPQKKSKKVLPGSSGRDTKHYKSAEKQKNK
jgi:hypothetical protein